ncbi:MAG: 5-(carboxyamino)imidazole ribonucleotide mutase [Planctomycetaceae bacterium]|nr:5-(carboxyamino)imidazole ribonucleotide mutase [Planctomycetaceae bacterium]
MTQSDTPIDVLIMMGSDSDWPAMSACHELLDELNISHEVMVASAHRTPAKVHQVAASVGPRGVKVLICAAGMAAHLAGSVAALVDVPVVGVPMPGGMMDGLDALLSTVQMPPGVPVATVGVGKAGAKNAAVLTAQIMSLSDADLAKRLRVWRNDQAKGVEAKNLKLQDTLKSS